MTTPVAEPGGRLPHLLPPAAYFDPAWAAREREALLWPAWHLVATTAELARPGDYVTASLLGVAVLVRNMGGEVVALSNVCSHRHCLLRSAERGHDARLACPYHGWEFGADGRTRTIPAARGFAPLDREALTLPRYRVATCGQLVYVCLDPDAPPMEDRFGALWEEARGRFGAAWRPTLRRTFEQEANWKAVIENSLEAYHVPHVHPNTLREDPGPSRSLDEICSGRTLFATTHFASISRFDQAAQLLERGLSRALGRGHEGRYWHHHVFPNLTFSFTDTISLAMCVLPDGPRASRLVVRQFGPGGGLGWGPLAAITRGWGLVGARITERILEEDRRLMPSLQRGLEASPHAGVLGWGERRIHAFQAHVQLAMAEPGPATDRR